MSDLFLEQIHEGHIGSSKMKALTQSCAYWPGFSKDIENYVQRCQSCTVYKKTADKPPLTEIANQATEPYEVISVDLTGPSQSTQGKTLLTIIDHYSRYPEVYILHRVSSRDIMEALRANFSKFGIPQKLLSDNGTPFVSSEFETFLSMLGVKHIYSANYHPIANGCIERFHYTLKSRLNRIFYDQTVSLQAAIDKVLFDIRSTPNAITGDTPFFRLFSHNMRTKLSLLTKSDVFSASRDASKEYRNKYLGRIVQYYPNDFIFYRKGAGQLFSGQAK
ncbi:MAG: DDE-type integrase/transposase/recombinase [Gammaproteobacteria bacterium]|nr:DDE-type integrase/transposase/recombinase [Gammaproteobacteria bacterium]